MLLLDGRLVAAAVQAELKDRVSKINKLRGRPPRLDVILVGEDKASKVYVANKEKACAQVGIASRVLKLSDSIKQAELESEILQINQDQNIDALLVQLPLPKHLDSGRVIEILSPSKDADGMTLQSLGSLMAQRSIVKPCTPAGVMRILEHYKIDVAGKKVVVVGRSLIVGRPMAELVNQANGTVTICHSHTRDLRSYTSTADIVIVAAGKPMFLGKEDFKQGSVVIDVGMHRKEDGKLCGDVRFAELEGHVKAATPVPGGVGPMTIAMLLANTVTLAERSR